MNARTFYRTPIIFFSIHPLLFDAAAWVVFFNKTYEADILVFFFAISSFIFPSKKKKKKKRTFMQWLCCWRRVLDGGHDFQCPILYDKDKMNVFLLAKVHCSVSGRSRWSFLVRTYGHGSSFFLSVSFLTQHSFCDLTQYDYCVTHFAIAVSFLHFSLANACWIF